MRHTVDMMKDLWLMALTTEKTFGQDPPSKWKVNISNYEKVLTDMGLNENTLKPDIKK